jgi:hypothetical protein
MTTPNEYEERKQCLEDTKSLTKEQAEGLFRVIHAEGVNYSENSNGIFFDLGSLDAKQFAAIKSFIALCKTQQQSEQERTKELEGFLGNLQEGQ